MVDYRLLDSSNIDTYLGDISNLFQEAQWISGPEKIIELLNITGAFAVIAESFNNVIGFAYCVCYPEHAWTGYITTSPKYRKQGIATELNKIVIGTCYKRNLKSIRLITRKELISFYSRAGYVVERNVATYEKYIDQANSLEKTETKDIKDICKLDKILFNGDRGKRLQQHVDSHNPLLGYFVNGICRGYAASWYTKKFTRIGPIVLPKGDEDFLFQIFIPKIYSYNGKFQILIYDDDKLLIDAAIRNGFVRKRSWVQMKIDKDQKRSHKQSELIRTIWGRSTG